MSHSSRFSFFDRPDDDLLKHADSLKIELMRSRDGSLSFTYELSGGHLKGWSDDDDDEGGVAEIPVDVERTVDSLMRRFAAHAGKRGAE